jgi:hypothetical protein
MRRLYILLAIKWHDYGHTRNVHYITKFIEQNPFEKQIVSKLVL